VRAWIYYKNRAKLGGINDIMFTTHMKQITRQDIDSLLNAGARAQVEKYAENNHKPPITTLSLDEAYEGFKAESWELAEEMKLQDKRDPVKTKREIGDCMVYLAAMAVACERQIAKEPTP
jgi:NTP pyrophosphatase (non-canonical NTP hydrolase)